MHVQRICVLNAAHAHRGGETQRAARARARAVCAHPLRGELGVVLLELGQHGRQLGLQLLDGSLVHHRARDANKVQVLLGRASSGSSSGVGLLLLLLLGSSLLLLLLLLLGGLLLLQRVHRHVNISRSHGSTGAGDRGRRGSRRVEKRRLMCELKHTDHRKLIACPEAKPAPG